MTLSPATSAAVEAAALEYLRGLEAGAPPDPDQLAQRLPSGAERAELRELCAAAGVARGVFPAPFRSQVLVAARYRLRDELGSGGFGRVWTAFDEVIGREVAVKLLHPPYDDDAVDDGWRRELQALAQLRDDGVVRLFDLGRHGDTPFLVMERVDGPSLRQVLAAPVLRASGYPPPPVAIGVAATDWFRAVVDVVHGVLTALSAAHRAGILHRDLKPANVLLRRDGRPVLVDFGLSSLRDGDGALTRQLVGTAAYLAPEQLARGRLGKDVRTDVYQAGLLLYELLTLQPAFVDDGSPRVFEAVRNGAFAPPRRLRPAVPRALDDVCRAALATVPERRYPDAAAFAADLMCWRRGDVPMASRIGALGRLRRGAGAWLRPRPRRAAVVAAALVALACGGGALLAAGGIDVRVLDGAGRATVVRVRDGDVLDLWQVGTDADGRDVAVPRAVVVRPGAVAAFALPAPADGVAVGLAPAAVPLRGDTRLRLVPASAADAAAWDEFARRAEARAADLGRPLRRDELLGLRDELAGSTRGGADLGGVDVALLFD